MPYIDKSASAGVCRWGTIALCFRQIRLCVLLQLALRLSRIPAQLQRLDVTVYPSAVCSLCWPVAQSAAAIVQSVPAPGGKIVI